LDKADEKPEKHLIVARARIRFKIFTTQEKSLYLLAEILPSKRGTSGCSEKL
jgi:hypothetical protein